MPCCIHVKSAPSFKQLFSFSKLLVVVFGQVSVEDLVTVKDALATGLTSISSHAYGFRFDGK